MENLDDHAIEQVAAFFAAFAVPMRLKILNALRRGERSVGGLAADLGGSQANVSKHLAVLAQKGLIAKDARGTSAFYRIADPRIYQLCDLVCVQIGERHDRQSEVRNPFVKMAKAAGSDSRKRTKRR